MNIKLNFSLKADDGKLRKVKSIAVKDVSVYLTFLKWINLMGVIKSVKIEDLQWFHICFDKYVT